MHVIVAGVGGGGKTTIGNILRDLFGFRYLYADKTVAKDSWDPRYSERSVRSIQATLDGNVRWVEVAQKRGSFVLLVQRRKEQVTHVERWGDRIWLLGMRDENYPDEDLHARENAVAVFLLGAALDLLKGTCTVRTQ